MKPSMISSRWLSPLDTLLYSQVHSLLPLSFQSSSSTLSLAQIFSSLRSWWRDPWWRRCSILAPGNTCLSSWLSSQSSQTLFFSPMPQTKLIISFLSCRTTDMIQCTQCWQYLGLSTWCWLWLLSWECCSIPNSLGCKSYSLARDGKKSRRQSGRQEWAWSEQGCYRASLRSKPLSLRAIWRTPIHENQSTYLFLNP